MGVSAAPTALAPSERESVDGIRRGRLARKTVTASGRFATNEMQAAIAAAIAGYGIAQ
jgi:hypothetical protein